jgi:hypothetical protein
MSKLLVLPDGEMLHKCTQCPGYFPAEFFHRAECKTCHAKKVRETYRSDRAKYLRRIHERKIVRYDPLIMQEAKTNHDGKCKICRIVPKTIYVDHDHISGRFRGFLCNRCNLTLGLMNDNPRRLRRAAHYLEESLHV